MDELSPRIEELAGVIGIAAALTLVAERGGTQIYIPATVKPGHWLHELLGPDTSSKLAAHFGGSRLDLPVGPTGAIARLRRRIDDMIANGYSERQIALETGYSGRGVRKRKASIRDRSPDLFSE